MAKRKGVLLFAHGARDANWAQPFRAVEARVREGAAGSAVALAFLEFMPPTLAEAGRALAEDGCDAVEVVPLFLGAGGHVRNDVPRLIDALRAAHPAVCWTLHTAVGEAPEVIAAMAAAALAADADNSAAIPTGLP